MRTALGPNAGPGLDVVRIGETKDGREFVTLRSRARFAPLPGDSSLSEQLHFGDPVVLLRAPFRLSFAYAGTDRVWKASWHQADKLPSMVKLTVRDAASERVLSVSTATPVHVDAPARSGNPDGSRDDAKDGAKDDGKNTGAAQKQGGS